MAHCPSQDWDRYNDGMEAQAESEARFWLANKERVLQVACAILSNPGVDPFKIGEDDVIEQAGKIVTCLVMTRCGEEY